LYRSATKKGCGSRDVVHPPIELIQKQVKNKLPGGIVFQPLTESGNLT
jgi:hypothetical protein